MSHPHSAEMINKSVMRPGYRVHEKKKKIRGRKSVHKYKENKKEQESFAVWWIVKYFWMNYDFTIMKYLNKNLLFHILFLVCFHCLVTYQLRGLFNAEAIFVEGQ